MKSAEAGGATTRPSRPRHPAASGVVVTPGQELAPPQPQRRPPRASVGGHQDWRGHKGLPGANSYSSLLCLTWATWEGSGLNSHQAPSPQCIFRTLCGTHSPKGELFGSRMEISGEWEGFQGPNRRTTPEPSLECQAGGGEMPLIPRMTQTSQC